MTKKGKKSSSENVNSDQEKIIESALNNTTSLNPVLGLSRGDLGKSLASGLRLLITPLPMVRSS